MRETGWLVVSLGILAATPAASAQYMSAKGCQQLVSTAEMAGCFSKAADEADARLNKTYTAIQSFLVSEKRTADRDALRKAERAWIEYRNATCAAVHGLYGGGTAGPVEDLACVEAITRERTENLKTGYGWLLDKFGHPL